MCRTTLTLFLILLVPFLNAVEKGPNTALKSYDHIKDIDYAGTNNSRQTLDLFVLKNNTTPLPIIVYIHGGAWRAGNKRKGLQVLPSIMKGTNASRYAYASIGYRLSGEAQWPAQIHDCKAAIRWIRANAKKYNIDPGRIGVWGPSAGGHLVAMLGTSGDDKAMEGRVGSHTEVSSRVTCVVDFYGPTNFLKMNKYSSKMDHDSEKSPESKLVGGAIQKNKEKVATANPITYVSRDDPPFLLVHGNKDPLVPYNQSELLHGALKKIKKESTFITIDGGGHGRGFGTLAYEYVEKFFAHHLLGIEITWLDVTIKASSSVK